MALSDKTTSSFTNYVRASFPELEEGVTLYRKTNYNASSSRSTTSLTTCLNPSRRQST